MSSDETNFNSMTSKVRKVLRKLAAPCTFNTYDNTTYTFYYDLSVGGAQTYTLDKVAVISGSTCPYT